MEVLEKLLIQNFQAHSRLRIDFATGVTTIIGPSDVGKSAILRALRWVALNTPGGDAFVRTGTKGAVVRLVVDGHTIERRRGGDVNTYKLDEAKYKAFGRGVPDPIKDLLNTGAVCWQGQHDAPFWFAETAGEVSRQLNSIVNLGIIDETLARVTAAYTRARTRLEMSETRLTIASENKSELKWVPKFDAAVQALERLATGLADVARDVVNIATLCNGAKTHHRMLWVASAAARAGGSANFGGKVARAAAREAHNLGINVADARKWSEAAARPVGNIAPVEAAKAKVMRADVDYARLRHQVTEVRKREQWLTRSNEAIAEAKKLLPNRCPTCGTTMIK